MNSYNRLVMGVMMSATNVLNAFPATTAKADEPDTLIKVGGEDGPIESRLTSTITGEDGPVYLTRSNIRFQFIRYTPPTSPPTAFITLDFDYTLTWSDKKFDGVPILVHLQDSAGNNLHSTFQRDMFARCGTYHYRSQVSVDPKYFIPTERFTFEIKWDELVRRGLHLKECS